jgi:2-methylcitrate dehydratase PrpD
VGRPAGTPSGRWFAISEAVLKGVRASDAASHGFCGDMALYSEPWLKAQAGHEDVEIAALENAGPSIVDVGFKPFPIARQGENAVAAFQELLSRGLDPDRIDTIEVFVPAINVALLSRPARADDRLSRISNVGYQFAYAALAPETLYDAERASGTDKIAKFAARVSVRPTSEFDAEMPGRWPARVVVNAEESRSEESLIAAPFDADGKDLVPFLTEKWRRLAGLESSAASHATLWRQIAEHMTKRADT